MSSYKGVAIRRDKRLAIYLRDGLACSYCASTLENGVTFSLDHLVPQSQGGTNHESNLITSCRKCNCSRQDQPVKEFVASISKNSRQERAILEHIETTRQQHRT